MDKKERFFYFGLLPIIGLFIFFDRDTAPAKTDHDINKNGAWYACQQSALSQFKAPSQVEFGRYPVTFSLVGTGSTYAVQGEAHAPNNFGVRLRHLVSCDVVITGDSSRFDGWSTTSSTVNTF